MGIGINKMDNRTFYEVYIKGGSLGILKVLFYYDDVEFWAEEKEQQKLKDVFLDKWWGKNDEILSIQKISMDYFDVIK